MRQEPENQHTPGDHQPIVCAPGNQNGVEYPTHVHSHSVEFSAEERHELVGACPKEGHKDVPREGTPALQGQAKRTEALQPAEEKAPGRPDSGLSVFKEGM